MDYDLIVIAGEPSGDLHAAAFLQKLRILRPHLKIAAVSGPLMKKAYPHDEILSVEKLSIMGFIDVVKNAFKLIKLYKQILNFILSHPSKLVIFVDYPGMNLKLAKKLKEKNYPSKLWHYIAPTAWAWKKNRVFTLKKTLDKLFCILPFEKSFFSDYGINTYYAGHPLVKKIKDIPIKKTVDPKLVALFPGSRKHELLKNLKLMLQACQELLKKCPDLRFEICLSSEHFKPLIEDIVKQSQFHGKLSYSQDSIDLGTRCRMAIAKSGTCNLELALLGTPTVVVYAITKLDVFIAKSIFKINLPFLSLPNLILNKEVMPELYGPNFTLEKLLFHAERVLQGPMHDETMQKQLLEALTLQDPSNFLAEKINQII